MKNNIPDQSYAKDCIRLATYLLVNTLVYKTIQLLYMLITARHL